MKKWLEIVDDTHVFIDEGRPAFDSSNELLSDIN